MSEEYNKSIERVKPSGLELIDRLVGVNRVTKVTKGGRAFGFSAIVVVGDEKGVVGHGLGKSKEVSEKSYPRSSGGFDGASRCGR